MSRARWRLIIGPDGDDASAAGPAARFDDVPAATGARNMAVDQALLESAQTRGTATLRFYAWRPACLSFGRNQSARGIYDPAGIAGAGLDVVRRPTGGLAVLHDQELTYSVAAPVARVGSPRRAYAAVNRALVTGLRALGVPAALAPAPARARGPVGDAAVPCFQDAAEGEVVAAGRKLVGSAQRYERRAILQHGSILLAGDQSLVARLAGGVATTTAPATLTELLGAAPPPAALARALARAFADAFDAVLEPDALTSSERVATTSHESRYAGDDWTWRR